MVEASGDVLRLIQPLSGIRLRSTGARSKTKKEMNTTTTTSGTSSTKPTSTKPTSTKAAGTKATSTKTTTTKATSTKTTTTTCSTSTTASTAATPSTSTAAIPSTSTDATPSTSTAAAPSTSAAATPSTSTAATPSTSAAADCSSPTLDAEFHSLKALDENTNFTTVEASKPENMSKNRYRNVLPYDQNRVILRTDLKGQSDYINASYIRTSDIADLLASVKPKARNRRGFPNHHRHESKKTQCQNAKTLSDEALKEAKRCIKMDKTGSVVSRNILNDKMYIAAQGCLFATVNDFWRMLWQEDVRVVVMITNEIERGKNKCEHYWPEYGQEQVYGELTVKSMTETISEDYNVREFDVNDSFTCRTMYQYQFQNWPDHSAPFDAEDTLKLIDDINRRMYRVSKEKDAPERNLMCVHCSAGMGRTGTFIVLDMLIDHIKQARFSCEIDILESVKLVRVQRTGMVQNKSQYKFIYMAIQSYVDANNITLKKKIFPCDT